METFKLERVTVHCSVTPNGKRINLAALEKSHKARGFKKIGYHYLIDVDGTVYDYQSGLRALNEEGAHVEGHNHNNVGICLVGDTKFTDPQFLILRRILDTLKFPPHDLKNWQIFAHNQWDTAIKQGKTCPNIPINNLLAWYIGLNGEAIKGYVHASEGPLWT